MLVAEGAQRPFDPDRIVVSKTNLKGHIQYANRMFLDLAEYDERDLLGQPHNVIRSQAMPRCIFKLLWDRLMAGREVFAYVVNATKNNNHYWVFAHVTPSRNARGEVTSYHSNRRHARPEAIAKISEIYAMLLAVEGSHQNRKEGLKASTEKLEEILAELGMDYDEFVFTL
ncbi:PAS domain-containing protein [Maritalea mediterranea]|uniref:PAS domain-containing protein n=1 Tax=Maritalea mediterranea TaxID=2909667 RepID=A0ABS9EEU5_9HYPH|nr:PAS domain-containing protein [Maritalea mediterranea]MCF4099976.1 PAS domain-containing protein [Maritalea mediterranea]